MSSEINRRACPICRSVDLTLEGLNAMTDGTVEQDYECHDCAATWTLVYTLTGHKDLKSDDAKLTPQRLAIKYDPADGSWGQHPTHLRINWQAQVINDLTQIGYWEWVAASIEQAGDSA